MWISQKTSQGSFNEYHIAYRSSTSSYDSYSTPYNNGYYGSGYYGGNYYGNGYYGNGYYGNGYNGYYGGDYYGNGYYGY